MSDEPKMPDSPENPTAEVSGDVAPDAAGGVTSSTTDGSDAPESTAGPTPEPPVERTDAETPAIAPAEAVPGKASDAVPTPVEKPSSEPGPKSGGYFWGTGRRKSAVARVRIRLGSGKFLIRKREINDYFFDVRHRLDVVAPLKATDTFGKYDVFVNVIGGGQMGQAGAILLGVARALLKVDPALEDTLRHGRFLTRDARKVERKKYGRRGARRRFQFSKR